MIRFHLVLLALAACGGGAKYPGGTTPGKPTETMPKGGIEAAMLPYEIIERGGRGVAEADFWTRMTKARAVCIGEEHPNPHHHWVQLHFVREMSKRIGKEKFALGLEMFQRPFQGPLDDYAAKRIDAETLKSRSGWAERWGYDWGFYGPTLDAAIGAGGQLLALNAPRELIKKVVRQGLESLTTDEKSQVPELVLDDQNHRAWFDALMGDLGGANVHSKKEDPEKKDEKKEEKKMPDDKVHGGGANPHNPHGGGNVQMPSAERIYTAQVMWDETMADGGAKWLKANPNGHLIILAGNGHCHDSAIVSRLKRRGVTDVISLRPVIDNGEDGALANVLAKPMNDYVVVLKLPKTQPKTAQR
jgi:uncharacterized iron-regulated protein